MKHCWLKDNQPNWEWIEQQDWFVALQECPQDPIFHAEGNVGIHTKMVVEALLQLEEYQAVSPEEQELLRWAALWHDVAKPICTLQDEEGKWCAPRHAKVGAKWLRQQLWDWDWNKREAVCNLVDKHGLPIWCLDKENPYRAVAANSLNSSNQLLYILSKADVLGRISSGQDDFLNRVELFKEFCLEQECFYQAKAFHNQHSQFKFFLKNERHPAALFDDTTFEVILLAGLPGAGKDTYIQQLNYPVVSLDALRVAQGARHQDTKAQGRIIQAAYEQAKAYAATQQSFIWNSTNLTRAIRFKLIATLSVYNPRFSMVYVECREQEVWARRQASIPRKKLQKMWQSLEVPAPYEVHELVYHHQ